MTFLLDTDVVVNYLRNKPGAWELLDELLDKGDLAMTVITVGELEYGARLADNYQKEIDKMRDVMIKLNVKVEFLSNITMRIYADIRRKLEIKGNKLDDFDLLIAAIAMEYGSTLVTGNKKHFERIEGLKVY
ncbi:MAG: type II toxin-antitoxin system VapC family toxin [Patescibacteria group bacterium]